MKLPASSVHRRRRALAAACCGVAAAGAAACGGAEPAGPDPLPPVRYALVSVVDRPLPGVMPDTDGVRPELHGGALVLRGDSTFRLEWHFHRVRLATGAVTRDTVRAAGRYRALRADVLLFEGAERATPPITFADVRGDSLVFAAVTFRR